MDLIAKIKAAYPELTVYDFIGPEKKILVCDDGDGVQYIAKWDYKKPIPEGFILGKAL